MRGTPAVPRSSPLPESTDLAGLVSGGRVQDDLRPTVLALVEVVVTLGGLGQRELVGDQEAGFALPWVIRSRSWALYCLVLHYPVPMDCPLKKKLL
jgi:hypothetical protein